MYMFIVQMFIVHMADSVKIHLSFKNRVLNIYAKLIGIVKIRHFWEAVDYCGPFPTGEYSLVTMYAAYHKAFSS